MTRSVVTGNRAVYGGGLGLYQDLDVRLYDSLIERNTALLHAGGLECLQCYEVYMSRWVAGSVCGGGREDVGVQHGGRNTCIKALRVF